MKRLLLLITICISSVSFGQNKKEQIASLSSRIDSLKTLLLLTALFISSLSFGQYSGIKCVNGKGEILVHGRYPENSKENPVTGNFYDCTEILIDGKAVGWVSDILEFVDFYNLGGGVDGVNWYGTYNSKSWYKSGDLKNEISVKDGIGYIKGYYANGKLKSYKEINHFISFVQFFYENGQLSRQSEFEQGIGNGEFKIWYENGQLKSLYNIKKGERNGNCKEWFENGQLSKDYNYSDGKMNGVCKRWSEDGTIIKDEFYSLEKTKKAKGY